MATSGQAVVRKQLEATHTKVLFNPRPNVYDGIFYKNYLRLNARKEREKTVYQKNESPY